MDFRQFERLVLRLLFETDVPLTAINVAYLGNLSVRTTERHLARMVEEGSLLVRSNAAGHIEYYVSERHRLADGTIQPPTPDLFGRAPGSALTAVLLSMMIPGAGHIYTGRSGAGVAWMATTLAGYACCFLPGLFLHGLCLVSAANSRQS